MNTKYKTDNDDWNEHWKNVNFLAKYNPGQILRHRLVLNTVHNLKIKQGWVLIDFGSGQGDMIKRLSDKFTELKMIGLEYSEFGVQFSIENNQSAEFLVADLTSPNLNSSLQLKADIITCCDVMEHIDNPESVVKNAYAMLNIGGTFIVTLPGGPMSILDKHIGHRRHYNRTSLEDLLREGGFRKYNVYSAGWPFFNLYRYMLLARGEKLIKDVSSETSVIKTAAIKIIGFIFALLFKLNLSNTLFGWQMFAIAEKID